MPRFSRLLLVSLVLFVPAGFLGAEEPTRKQRQGWAQQGRSAMKEQAFDAAVPWFEKAVTPGARKRDLARWWPRLGRCYENLKNYQKALRAYQKAHDLRPKEIDRKLDLARVYAAVDLRREAITLYREVLKKDKKRRDVAPVLAKLYLETDQAELAKEEIYKYIRWEPRDLAAQRLLARIEESLGELAASAHRWEGILSKEPGGEEFFLLGSLWARQGQFDLAQVSFGRARELGISSSRLFLEWGLVEWRRGEAKNAARLWRRALEETDDIPTARFFLALNDFEEGRLKAATAAMKKVEKAAGKTTLGELASIFLEGTGG